MLTLHKLIEVGVKGLLRNIAVNIYIWIGIALTNNSTGTLFQVRGSPRAIYVVKCDKSVLNIRAGSHLLCRTKQDSDLAFAGLLEQFFFLHIGVRFVDKAYLAFGDTTLNELFSDVVIHRECAVILWC